MYISEYDKERIFSLYLKRYSYQEIASKTNIPKATVAYHITQLRQDREALNNIAKEFEAEYRRIRLVIEKQVKDLNEELEKNPPLSTKLKLMDMIKEREQTIWSLLGNGELVMWARNLNEYAIKGTGEGKKEASNPPRTS